MSATAATVVLIAAFWTVWFVRNDWLASDSSPGYHSFENAFPLADAWVAGCAALAFAALRTRRPTAVLWLLLTAGGAGFLTLIDVLYDLENGIYAKGAGGAIEAVINVLTASLTVLCATYGWRARRQLDPVD